MKAVFDTSILIDYLSGRAEAAAELGKHRQRAVSVITWMEVLAGAHDDEEADVIDLFLRDFELVGVTRPIAREAVALQAKHRIRLPDAVIWATARTESALLITRNTKDFPAADPAVRVPY